jgi:hypothetical protein
MREPSPARTPLGWPYALRRSEVLRVQQAPASRLIRLAPFARLQRCRVGQTGKVGGQVVEDLHCGEVAVVYPKQHASLVSCGIGAVRLPSRSTLHGSRGQRPIRTKRKMTNTRNCKRGRSSSRTAPKRPVRLGPESRVPVALVVFDLLELDGDLSTSGTPSNSASCRTSSSTWAVWRITRVRKRPSPVLSQQTAAQPNLVLSYQRRESSSAKTRRAMAATTIKSTRAAARPRPRASQSNKLITQGRADARWHASPCRLAAPSLSAEVIPRPTDHDSGTRAQTSSKRDPLGPSRPPRPGQGVPPGRCARVTPSRPAISTRRRP